LRLLRACHARPLPLLHGFLLSGLQRPSRGSIAFPVRVRAESPRRGTASPELHPCAIADSLADTSAYVCLRIPAPRAPRSSSRKPFHNAPPAPHPHTHACTLSSCSATSPGARPLHTSPVCRSRLRKSSLCAPALALQLPRALTPRAACATAAHAYCRSRAPFRRHSPSAHALLRRARARPARLVCLCAPALALQLPRARIARHQSRAPLMPRTSHQCLPPAPACSCARMPTPTHSCSDVFLRRATARAANCSPSSHRGRLSCSRRLPPARLTHLPRARSTCALKPSRHRRESLACAPLLPQPARRHRPNA
jgi:hypothetical protein